MTDVKRAKCSEQTAMNTSTLDVIQSSGETLQVVGRNRLSVFEGGLVMLLASAFGCGLNYLLMLYLARALGASEFGVYVVGVTLFNTVTLLVVFGMDSAVVKFISEYRAGASAENIRRTIAFAAGTVVLVGVIAAGLFGLLVGPVASGLYATPELRTLLWWFAPAIPLVLVGTVFLAALQGLQIVRYTVLIKYSWEPIGKLLLVGLCLWAGFGLTGVGASFLMAAAMTAAFGFLAVRKETGIAWSDVGTWQSTDRRRLFAYCGPLVVSSFIGVVGPRTDVMILGYWAGVQEAGVYAAAFQTAAILALVLAAFDFAFAPIMGEAWAKRDHKQLAEAYQSVHRLSLMVTVPLLVWLLVFGKECLGVFGQAFSHGAMALTILAVGHTVSAATGCANTVLLMSGKSRVVMQNTIVSGLGLVALTLLLIPLWGVTGAAIAAAASLMALGLVRVVEVWRLYKVLPWTSAFFKPLIAGALMAILLFLAKRYVEPASYLFLGIGGGLVYVLVLALMRLESDDHGALLVILNRFGLRYGMVPGR